MTLCTPLSYDPMHTPIRGTGVYPRLSEMNEKLLPCIQTPQKKSLLHLNLP